MTTVKYMERDLKLLKKPELVSLIERQPDVPFPCRDKRPQDCTCSKLISILAKKANGYYPALDINDLAETAIPEVSNDEEAAPKGAEEASSKGEEVAVSEENNSEKAIPIEGREVACEGSKHEGVLVFREDGDGATGLEVSVEGEDKEPILEERAIILEESDDEAGNPAASPGGSDGEGIDGSLPSDNEVAGPADSDSDASSGSDGEDDSETMGSSHWVITPEQHLSYNNARLSRWVAQQGLEKELEFFLAQKKRKSGVERDQVRAWEFALNFKNQVVGRRLQKGYPITAKSVHDFLNRSPTWMSRAALGLRLYESLGGDTANPDLELRKRLKHGGRGEFIGFLEERARHLGLVNSDRP